MTEDELLGLIDTYASSSYGGEQGQLADEQAKGIARYNGEPYGDERDGRSQLVSTELRDTVETVVPQLMRIFLGGDQICEFNPETPDDVPQSKEESKYVNFVVTQRNPAFQVFGTWFRDALICKNGYVKAWWEDRSDVQTETYRGKNDDEFMVLSQDPCVKVVAHTAYPDPMFPAMQELPQAMGMPQQPQAQQQPMLHDVKVKRVKTYGFVRLDNLPSEEIRVHTSTRGPDLRDAIYVEHRVNKTLSEIRQMGYDVPDDWAGVMTDSKLNLESKARDRFNDLQFLLEDGGSDPSTRRATFREVWIRVDEDGDGIAELRKICLVNKHIVADDEADLIPIACITPVIQPHRHIGYGYYDFLKEIERATTSMLRSFFDNIYLANNGRYGVDVDKVNVDDLLISRPGGIVRTKGAPGEAIFPITHPSMGDAAMQGMNYLASWKKSATGVVMDSGAISSDVLSKAPASSISQVISVWQARVEGVARCFAETGMTDLFRIVHALTSQNATSAERVQLGGEWVQVDPREWVKRTSITVTVGLGTGSKEAKLAFLQQVASAQQAGLQIGIATPPNLYETAIEMMKEGGYKDGARFWTDPRKSPPMPQKKDPMVEAQTIKTQGELQQSDMKHQAEAQKFQAEQASKPQEAQVEIQKAVALAEVDARAKIAIAERTAQIDAQTKLAIANIEIAARERMDERKLLHQPVMTGGQHMAAQ